MDGWQGYRYDLAMVFDTEFDIYVEKTIAPIVKYAWDGTGSPIRTMTR